MGEALKQIRLKNGFTQKYVAKTLGFKSNSIVSMWESGARMPITENLIKLAGMYNCTVDELLALADDEEQDQIAKGA